jgi:1-deoxy-D-xylulose-5-phosphate reductoisomerase
VTDSIIILGSTGSIGTQTLEVCEHLGLHVAALAAGRNLDRLEGQIRRWQPSLVSVATAAAADELKRRLCDYKPAICIEYGPEGNLAAATLPGRHRVVAAMVGVAGLAPVMAAIRAGKSIALANKETLVAGGALVMPLLKEYDGVLYPVDSEHSAIWQCLAGSAPGSLRRILLTSSGGPFRGRSRNELASVTRDEALRHPTWQMGGKITIDSATLMNKGLEVIEASWLFDCPVDRIQVVVHPQSIIHSMVELNDGSVLAQMGFPDMKLPIQLALTWPDRLPSQQKTFDPFDPRAKQLTFEPPDSGTFRLLDLAYEAGRRGGTLPVALNAANEAAVELFLDNRIGFLDIAGRVEKCLVRHLDHDFKAVFSLDDLMYIDHWARDDVKGQ